MRKPNWLTGWLATTLAVTSMAFLTGCAEEESELGGPGADELTSDTESGTADEGMNTNGTAENGAAANRQTANGEAVDPEEQTFRLQFPDSEQEIVQGTNTAVMIALERGDAFDQTVQVTFKPPEGVTLAPETLTFDAGETEQEVTITVEETVAPGSHSINVHGQPETGKAVDATFLVEVTKPEE